MGRQLRGNLAFCRKAIDRSIEDTLRAKIFHAIDAERELGEHRAERVGVTDALAGTQSLVLQRQDHLLPQRARPDQLDEEVDGLGGTHRRQDT